MIGSIIIAVIALIISVVVANYSYRLRQENNKLIEEQTRLQRRVLELEEQQEKLKLKGRNKADLRIRLIRNDAASYTFQIHNKGPAEITHFSFKINGEPPHIYDRILSDLESIPKIQSGKKYERKISYTKGQKPFMDVTANFKDSTGKHVKKYRLLF
jgi:Na+-transporting NADH:ubiquinone oxidoreductase subunit NqrC